MRFFKLFGVALAALCAIAAMASPSAFALPTVLPEGAKTFTGKGTEFQWQTNDTNKVVVGCPSSTAEGLTEASKPLGLFHILVKECAADGEVCTGKGEASGVILLLGTYHLVYDHLATLLSGAGVAVLYLLSTVMFECSPLATVEILLGGMVLCLISNPTALTKVFEDRCKAVRTGMPEESKYYNAAGTLVSISTVLVRINSESPAESALASIFTIESEATLIMI